MLAGLASLSRAIGEWISDSNWLLCVLLRQAYRDYWGGSLFSSGPLPSELAFGDLLFASLVWYFSFYGAVSLVFGLQRALLHITLGWAGLTFGSFAFWLMLTALLTGLFILIVLIRITVPRMKGESLSKLGWLVLLSWVAWLSLSYLAPFTTI